MDRTTRYIAAILRDDHILLVKHQFSQEYACWEIPGGGRLEGENESACIAREVREEAGLDVDVVGLLYDGPSHIHTFYQRFIVYRCAPRGESCLGPTAAQENILEARWFDLRDDSQLSNDVINSAITFSVIDRIRQALGYTYKTHPSGENMLIPTDLRCEYEYNPIALDTPLPRFSWVLGSTERGQVQTAYQILVAADEITLWDSGKVASAEQAAVYAGHPFASRQGASWQVRVWDAGGLPGSFSESCWFRLGLLQPVDWQAEWIGYPADWNGQALYFRREFSLDKPLRSAWVYVAGLGYYELHLNGEKVGDHVLDPGNTDYGKRVLYTTYNLRPFLRTGANVFGVILGNGWYGIPKLLLQAEFEYEDGTFLRVCTGHATTGASWMVGTGPILENSLYGGETYDARLEWPGWDSHLITETAPWGWAVVTDGPGGKLVSQRVEPIRVTETIQPRLDTQPRPGVHVFDLGQNIAGWARLRVKGERGDRVTLRYAESLYAAGSHNIAGTVNQENLRRARATDVYILKGGDEEVWESHFTYHGFRYVQVEGAIEPKIVGRVVRSDTSPNGTFECSNDFLNQIHKMVWWTEYTNQHSIPTDCPQRDERLGWLNDMAARTEQMLYNFDVSRFLPKWLDDIQDTQSPDGAITDTAPYRWGNRPADPVSVCYLLIPWLLYLHYGDTRTLADHYDSNKAWVDYLTRRSENHLLKYSYYGDWAPPLTESAAGTIGDSAISSNTSGELMSTGFYYYSTHLLSQMAQVLGKTAEAGIYTDLARSVAEAYNQRFWDKTTGGYGSNNQACNAFSLYLGIVPAEKKTRLLENLVADIEAHDDHLTTGNLCTKYLLEVLSDMGRADVAFRLAAQETYPSWGYMLANGATTLWERWEKMTGNGMNSHNHPMLGSVGSWFYKYLGGITIDPTYPGFAAFNIRPCAVDGLTYVRTSLKIPLGQIEVAWERQDDIFTLKVTIPTGSQARVAIPKPASACTISEGKTVIWKGDMPAGGIDHVQFFDDDTRHITFLVGSGEYSFARQPT
jgi:alpha-L-rhamnosidase